MPAPPFRIKVCGITRKADAQAVFAAGADAIGLNFYTKSPRYLKGSVVDLLELGGIHRSLYRPFGAVGLFVNASVNEILSHIELAKIDMIQLHGDEPPEFLAELPDLPIIRARRMDDRGVAAIAEDLEACRAAGRVPDAVLVDAFTPGRYGGTGETVSWAGLADHPRWLGEVPLILAGGLTPDNVAEAIRMVRPSGVDVASGVESAPGVKDIVKVRDFVAAATAAFESL
ncbi:phosphoribosylanthranilate isomerase [Aeoliella sp. ICT_H6.2]|uniref:N-(5'-phosphoribosyl)anthranilate isomerase n=1 Tax=Aeoliella straminimaris TaxID=2954799 RepID=A0A9X2F5F2_9BACT|nr:phosphoribosylanthranilate isomerase [Aeoliella straminimaris]MCO6042510.1 phosphoribosylanthranilate isomerase [Aeoliella straminimaris]